jgi:hypothetical protein
MEAGGLGEGPKIPIALQQWTAAIYAALSDRSIAWTRLAALRQHFRP